MMFEYHPYADLLIHHKRIGHVEIPSKFTQKQMLAENAACFLPRVIQFCEHFGMKYQVGKKYLVTIVGQGDTVLLDIAWLRLEHTRTGAKVSLHSSEIETVLYRQFYGSMKLPEDFYYTFPRLVFNPKG